MKGKEGSRMARSDEEKNNHFLSFSVYMKQVRPWRKKERKKKNCTEPGEKKDRGEERIDQRAIPRPKKMQKQADRGGGGVKQSQCGQIEAKSLMFMTLTRAPMRPQLHPGSAG